MTATESVILFADIHRSTALFERLGDEPAAQVVGMALEVAADIAARHCGRMIRTKGDDILCVFASAGEALHAAQDIHLTAMQDARLKAHGLAFRIGINQGPVIFADDTIYGDAVNTGARLVAQAKGRQTLISATLAATARRLFPDLVRSLGAFSLRGKSALVGVHELIPPESTEEITQVGPAELPEPRAFLLILRFQSQEMRLNPLVTRFVFGRSKDCDLMVNHPTISREHAEIRFVDGKFVFTDFSTNGSFVFLEGKTRLVHRSSQPLRGRGLIFIGRTLNDSLNAIQFESVSSQPRRGGPDPQANS